MIENYVHWNEDIGEWQLVSRLWHTHARAVVCDLINLNLKVQTGLLSCNFCLFTLSGIFQKCVAYTGNNMRKQTPAPDKKEKDVSSFYDFCTYFCCFCVMSDVSDILLHNAFSLLLSLPAVAIWGGPVACVSGLHGGEYAAVTDETGEAQDF